MASIGLETIVSCLPDTILKGEDFAYLDDCMSAEERAVFARPAQLRRLKGEDAVEQIGVQVARKALDRARLKPADVDFIIASNIGGKYQAPYIGTWIHQQLGFDRHTPVLNVFNACASFLDGLHMAWQLVRAGEYQRVLVVMVTAWDIKGEGLVDPTSPLAGIFGDGAGAAVVSSRNLRCEFLSYLSRTWGELYDHIAVRCGPVMHPELMQAAGTAAAYGTYLRVSRYAAVEWLQETGLRFAIEGIEAAARKADLGVADIDLVIFHQGPSGAVRPWIDGAVARGMRADQFRHTYDKYGNVGNIDIGLTLTELAEGNEIRNGYNIALLGMAGGGHAPTLILRWLA